MLLTGERAMELLEQGSRGEMCNGSICIKVRCDNCVMCSAFKINEKGVITHGSSEVLCNRLLASHPFRDEIIAGIKESMNLQCY